MQRIPGGAKSTCKAQRQEQRKALYRPKDAPFSGKLPRPRSPLEWGVPESLPLQPVYPSIALT